MSRHYYSPYVFLLALLSILTSSTQSAWAEKGALSSQLTSPAQLQEAWLLKDWLLQDAGKPESERCFTSKENSDREQRLVTQVVSKLGDDKPSEATSSTNQSDQPQVAELQKRLASLCKEAKSGDDPAWRELYIDACKLRRQRRLAHLAEVYPKIVFTKHYNLGGSHYAYTSNVTDAQFAERNRSNPDYRMGSSLCVLQLHEDGHVTTETLLHEPNGVIRDPDISYDGKRVLFAMRRSSDKDDYHLYEINLADRKVRQLTSGDGYADYEAIYLPSGDILFNSTRCTQIVDCWYTQVANLYACNSDGKRIRRVSVDQVHTNYPQLLSDGRVVYTRWDYNDRGQLFPQPLS